MKMKKTLTIISILTGLSIIGTGFYLIIKEQIKLMESYCWKVKDVLIKQFGFNNASLTVVLNLKNQSDINLEIIDYNFGIFLDDLKVADVKNTVKTVWKAKSISEIMFDINFNPSIVIKDAKKISNLAVNIFAYPQNVMFTAKGTVTVKHSFIKVSNLPIEYKTTFADLNKDDETPYECKIEGQ